MASARVTTHLRLLLRCAMLLKLEELAVSAVCIALRPADVQCSPQSTLQHYSAADASLLFGAFAYFKWLHAAFHVNDPVIVTVLACLMKRKTILEPRFSTSTCTRLLQVSANQCKPP